jgi:protein SCO1/2
MLRLTPLKRGVIIGTQGVKVRTVGACRVRFNSSTGDGKLSQDEKSQTEKPAPVSHGVRDPGTERHGYDPQKARKPLSRIALGSGAEKSKVSAKIAPKSLINWKAAIFFVATGGALTWMFQREKHRLEIERQAEANRAVGKPQVGGPFSLVDQNGNTFTHKDLLGKFSLIYFGFSMCPDICPEELEKMTLALKQLRKQGKEVQPVFITCDPARDTPQVLKDYLAEFDENIIGLTGSHEDIKQTCKHYRVYFSTPPDLKPGQQYLVDHSIFFYLMDPEGKFVDALGRNYDADQAAAHIKEHIDVWRPEADREKTKQGFWGGLFANPRN